MRKIVLSLALASTSVTLLAQGTEFGNPADRLQPPLPRREFRGAWVATVWNIDWPSSRTASAATQKSEIDTILNNAQALKLNGLFVQVRSMADAMYQSSIEPWSYFLKGPMGTAPNPFYDPLTYWITEGRKRGIQIYAWLNPYRALSNAVAAGGNHISLGPQASILRDYSGDKYFDPGVPDSYNRLQAVITDILTRYDVDGIVFDDYFYPYPDGTLTFPDSATYTAYQLGGGTLSLANWRRNNIDLMVSGLNTSIKQTNPQARFGIGPFGIWKPGNPAGVTGLSAFDSLYADTRKWIQLGWVDFISPQLYWKISSTGQPYQPLLTWWTQQNLMGRHVIPSNAGYKVADGTTTPWTTQEILDQIDVTRNVPGALGNVYYNFKAFNQNRDNLRTRMAAEKYAEPSLIPAATWIDNIAPERPSLTYSYNNATRVQTFNWTQTGEAARWFVIATHSGAGWTHQVVPATTTSLVRGVRDGGAALKAFSVAAVDRQGNVSPYISKVFDLSLVSSTPEVDASSGFSASQP